MSHAMPSTFRVLLSLILLSAVSGCALFEERTGPASFFGPREEIYRASFEEVWRSVNLVLQPYPLRTSNMDLGLLETELVKTNRIWTPPHKSDRASSGVSYKLTIKVIKGAVGSGGATKVVIIKDAVIQSDFFADPRAQPSDGLEEKSLLYRIGREIQIERALVRAQRRKNKATN